MDRSCAWLPYYVFCCWPGRAADRATRNSPDFKAGYSDGCASASLQGANPRDTGLTRDDAAYGANPAYHSGWGEGFGACRAMAAPQGNGSPGRSPCRAALNPPLTNQAQFTLRIPCTELSVMLGHLVSNRIVHTAHAPASRGWLSRLIAFLFRRCARAVYSAAARTAWSSLARFCGGIIPVQDLAQHGSPDIWAAHSGNPDNRHAPRHPRPAGN